MRSSDGSVAGGIQRCAPCLLAAAPDVTGRRTQVFEGIDSSNEESCVIKVLKPVAKKKIKREIKILRNLAGGPNVIRLMDIVHDPPSRSNSLIMEYVENAEWKEMFSTLTEMEIKFYLFQLLRVSSVRLRAPPFAKVTSIRHGPNRRWISYILVESFTAMSSRATSCLTAHIARYVTRIAKSKI